MIGTSINAATAHRWIRQKRSTSLFEFTLFIHIVFGIQNRAAGRLKMN